SRDDSLHPAVPATAPAWVPGARTACPHRGALERLAGPCRAGPEVLAAAGTRKGEERRSGFGVGRPGLLLASMSARVGRFTGAPALNIAVRRLRPRRQAFSGPSSD